MKMLLHGLISAEMLLPYKLEMYSIVFDIRAHSSHDDPMTNGTYVARVPFSHAYMLRRINYGPTAY